MSIRVKPEDAAWAVNPYPWEAAARLAAVLDLPLIAAMVLAGRGYTDPDAARTFLESSAPLPDPYLFGHMDAAVETISMAINARRRIVIHGDYDADGITATALLVLGLRQLGAEPEWYLPSRFNEGYGLSRTAVESVAAPGPALLVTVDCGVNYPEEVELARERGLDVVVVDHHRPGPVLPDCSVIHEVVGEYPHGDLCGVGLALKVLHALHIRRDGVARHILPASLYGMLDLVAIGSIADLAPLRGENRYYVREGLKLIGIGQRVGLRALASVASCSGVADSGVVAYRLAPRLNAAGRLADPSPPLRLLLTDDEREAHDLAARLHELNGARQDVERQILDEAVARVEALDELPPALVLAGGEWHEGVVGIVASRLVERYQRPAVLLGVRDGVAKGSGRSIPTYDLMGALNACADFLTVFGGHRQAVGLTLDESEVQGFREALEAHAGNVLGARDFVTEYRADAILRGEDLNADVALALASLGPFGTGNPRPRLLVVDGSLERAETTRNGAHLRCTVAVDGVRARAIGFGLGPSLETVRDGGRSRTIGVQLRVDEWQGTLRPELLLERIGDGGDHASHPARACDDGRAMGAGQSPKEEPTRSHAHRRSEALGFSATRDLRDAPGRLSALAQVLASGEPVMLVAGSNLQALPALERQLPLRILGGDDLACVDVSGLDRAQGALPAARVVLLEWEAVGLAGERARAGSHVVAIDPPFRAEQVAFLGSAAAEGASIHLYYGWEQRQAMARLLRYVVHPRFAMVCLFRAMQGGLTEGSEVFTRAASLAREEGGVTLSCRDFSRAATILEELGGGRGDLGEAKLEVRSSPTYIAAEADYEECVRLCQTL